jgi:glycosyltransferase involved in cell wall biosynthesis
MYHADLVGGIAARLGSAPPVIWNIRHTLVRRSDLKHSTLLVARVNAALSRLIPARIVCCAESALETHLRLGYARDKMLVIPNGFDLELFRPNPTARAEVRFALGVDETSPLIGMCGRFDLQKDHNNFFRAAGILHATRPDANFVLWGRGVDSANSLLAKWISAEDLQASVHLLGFRTDSQHINAALDIGTLSAAYGEAFPNVIGEAMSCGIPCVVTDVGDSAKIVGNTGRVVPPRQPEALAAAWQELLQLDPEERAGLGGRARQRVMDLFSLDRMADAYAELYRDIIGGARRLPAGS